MPFAVFSTAGLLHLVDTHLPLGAVGWEAVADKAKRIYRETESHSGAINLDDDIDDNSGYATVHEAEDDQEGEEDAVDHGSHKGSHPPEQDQDRNAPSSSKSSSSSKSATSSAKKSASKGPSSSKSSASELHASPRTGEFPEELALASPDLRRISSVDLSSKTAKRRRISQAVIMRAKESLEGLQDGLQTSSRQSAQLEREHMAAEECRWRWEREERREDERRWEERDWEERRERFEAEERRAAREAERREEDRCCEEAAEERREEQNLDLGRLLFAVGERKVPAGLRGQDSFLRTDGRKSVFAQRAEHALRTNSDGAPERLARREPIPCFHRPFVPPFSLWL
ncbi:hypothetical protein BDK51DRAFT_38412 [Blyttiomyces helicus]|uniref:Uncharacterized protein n=1 Tax=Blyttiomyces helicus TaxID=388810 RepID=A0A4V1IQP6_9FUNG|nr:hypothetical protein BDK51DRAFT_38412 [Blyttiomyces helicus]|eukprot:RKO87287.1 hypothetical protein BDK51DRAFT_38412 [Blyttiomyces helicus]